MAWQTRTIRVTGDVVTAADYNMAYYNERYLKGIDGAITLSNQLVGDAKAICSLGVGTHTHLTAGAEGGILNTIAASQPGYLVDTVYHNTSGKMLVVVASVIIPANSTARAEIGATSTPVTDVGDVSLGTGSGYVPISFIVPVNYYYRVSTIAGTPSIYAWAEYLLL
jgi:hypothetical protein